MYDMQMFSQDTEWLELPHSAIREIGPEIGKGAFGRVFIARVDDIKGKGSQIVAIKRLKSKWLLRALN